MKQNVRGTLLNLHALMAVFAIAEMNSGCTTFNTNSRLRHLASGQAQDNNLQLLVEMFRTCDT